MTADEYLRRVARGMAGMDRGVRDDVLRELKSHLADAARERGEAQALASAESPETVAARYKEMYGYGRTYVAVFAAIAAALAVPTLPLLLYGGSGLLAFAATLVFLSLLVAYLMAVAVKAGSTAGLVAGLAACVSRFASLAVLLAVGSAEVRDASGWVLFTVVSVLLIAIGFLPGRAKEKWRRRDVGL